MSCYTDPESGLNFYYYGGKGSTAGEGKAEQKYPDIVKQAKDSGKKFEDPNFPADATSLGPVELDGPVKWLRPKEIAKAMFKKNSHPIFHGPFDEFAINQGLVGDCWFLAALADVAAKPKCINIVVPSDNDDGGFDTGAFHFRFWFRGKWVDVVVDDRLPCVHDAGEPQETAFCRPTENSGFWAPLLEKAYAKLYGNYEALDGGYGMCAMLDFTGGFFLQYDSTTPNLKDILKHGISHDSLIVTATKDKIKGIMCPHDPNNPGSEGQTTTGIVCGHEYSVLDVRDVKYKKNKGSITLLKLRNPWGNDAEWNGDFSDSDPKKKWSTVTEDLRRPESKKRDDGEFWISFDAWKRYIDEIDVCHWSVSYHGDESIQRGDGANVFITTDYFTHANSGHVKGPNDLKGKPGFYVHLKPLAGNETKKGYLCGLAASLMYTNYKRAGDDPSIPEYGLYLLWGPGHTIPDEDFFKNGKNKKLEKELVDKIRETQNAKDWPEGTVLIVPWITKPPKVNEKVPYLLKIRCEGEVFKYDGDITGSAGKRKNVSDDSPAKKISRRK